MNFVFGKWCILEALPKWLKCIALYLVTLTKADSIIVNSEAILCNTFKESSKYLSVWGITWLKWYAALWNRSRKSGYLDSFSILGKYSLIMFTSYIVQAMRNLTRFLMVHVSFLYSVWFLRYPRGFNANQWNILSTSLHYCV